MRVLLVWLLLAAPALAHPGKLDEQGGHIDKRTGQHHYHRGPNALPSKSEGIAVQVTVIRVIDGDTFTARFPDGRIERVRIRGINTPEIGQPGAVEATTALERRIGGKTIIIRTRQGYLRDKYGRVLATVGDDQ